MNQNPLSDILQKTLQKTFYMGVGLASVATEKASVTINEIRAQAGKVADDLVARGEITAEEAKKFVDDFVRQAQRNLDGKGNPPDGTGQGSQSGGQSPKQPRNITIDDEDDASPAAVVKTKPVDDVDNLRQTVQDLQQELERLKKGGR